MVTSKVKEGGKRRKMGIVRDRPLPRRGGKKKNTENNTTVSTVKEGGKGDRLPLLSGVAIRKKNRGPEVKRRKGEEGEGG